MADPVIEIHGLDFSYDGRNNVLEAVDVCRQRGLKTIGLAGRDGGKLAPRVDLCLTVNHAETARIQEVHGMIVHLLCQVIEGVLFSED